MLNNVLVKNIEQCGHNITLFKPVFITPKQVWSHYFRSKSSPSVYSSFDQTKSFFGERLDFGLSLKLSCINSILQTLWTHRVCIMIQESCCDQVHVQVHGLQYFLDTEHNNNKNCN